MLTVIKIFDVSISYKPNPMTLNTITSGNKPSMEPIRYCKKGTFIAPSSILSGSLGIPIRRGKKVKAIPLSGTLSATVDSFGNL